MAGLAHGIATIEKFLTQSRTDLALVGGSSLFFSLFSNLAAFILLVAAYSVLNARLEKRSRQRRQPAVGILFGVFVFICMHVRIPVAPGVIVDQRNTIVILAGFFGGPLSALIAAVIGGVYRAYLGGIGVYGGILGLSLAAVAGTVLRALRPGIEAPGKFALCSLAATLFVLPGFLPIGSWQAGWELLKASAIPYGLAVFAGVSLAGLLMLNEERRRASARALRESESRYRGMFEDMVDIGYRTDAAGFLTIVSPSCEQTLGYRPDEMLGRPFTDFYRETARRAVLVEMLELQGSVKNFEIDLVRKDGTVATMWTNARLVTDSAGRAIGAEGILRDVTQTKKDAEEKRRLEERLRQSQKMESIGQLAGGIAHDFNNLLSVILGFTEMALLEIPPDSPQAKNLSQVLGAGERAKRLVSRILAFSRGGSAEKTILRLGPVLGEVIGFLKMTIPSSVSIHADLHDSAGPVNADPTQINEAVMNLASNSVHAMGGKGALSICLRAARLAEPIAGRIATINPGSYSVIEVSDTGVGMDSALVDKAFEPFFTTKPSGQGTGMGLSVVYGIMRDHGGDILVESAPGRGTSIRLYFPSIDAEPALPLDAAAEVRGGTERVLFVDDEAPIAEMMEKLLASLGYRVTSVTSPVHAFQLVVEQELGFDLLITDSNMPAMTGTELARKAIACHPTLPVILCTGYSSVQAEEQAHAVGVRAVCLKPIRKRELAEAIRRVLDSPGPRAG